jgi:hypothetical protein
MPRPKTIKKRMRAKLLAIKIELRRIMHDPIAKTGTWVKQMLKGHLNYFAVSGNHPSLWWFFNKVKRLWLASLKRRSQTARLRNRNSAHVAIEKLERGYRNEKKCLSNRGLGYRGLRRILNYRSGAICPTLFRDAEPPDQGAVRSTSCRP